MRAGVDVDPSAIPTPYLSPLTVDLDKVTVALGAGLHLRPHWRLDVVYAHVFGIPRDVSPAEAQIQATNPVVGNPTAAAAINGGHYPEQADLFGLGAAYRF